MEPSAASRDGMWRIPTFPLHPRDALPLLTPAGNYPRPGTPPVPSALLPGDVPDASRGPFPPKPLQDFISLPFIFPALHESGQLPVPSSSLVLVPPAAPAVPAGPFPAGCARLRSQVGREEPFPGARSCRVTPGRAGIQELTQTGRGPRRNLGMRRQGLTGLELQLPCPRGVSLCPSLPVAFPQPLSAARASLRGLFSGMDFEGGIPARRRGVQTGGSCSVVALWGPDFQEMGAGFSRWDQVLPSTLGPGTSQGAFPAAPEELQPLRWEPKALEWLGGDSPWSRG